MLPTQSIALTSRAPSRPAASTYRDEDGAGDGVAIDYAELWLVTFRALLATTEKFERVVSVSVKADGREGTEERPGPVKVLRERMCDQTRRVALLLAALSFGRGRDGFWCASETVFAAGLDMDRSDGSRALEKLQGWGILLREEREGGLWFQLLPAQLLRISPRAAAAVHAIARLESGHRAVHQPELIERRRDERKDRGFGLAMAEADCEEALRRTGATPHRPAHAEPGGNRLAIVPTGARWGVDGMTSGPAAQSEPGGPETDNGESASARVRTGADSLAAMLERFASMQGKVPPVVRESPTPMEGVSHGEQGRVPRPKSGPSYRRTSAPGAPVRGESLNDHKSANRSESGGSWSSGSESKSVPSGRSLAEPRSIPADRSIAAPRSMPAVKTLPPPGPSNPSARTANGGGGSAGGAKRFRDEGKNWLLGEIENLSPKEFENPACKFAWVKRVRDFEAEVMEALGELRMRMQRETVKSRLGLLYKIAVRYAEQAGKVMRMISFL